MRLHYIQHIQPENPGSILVWARDKGYPVTHTIIYENEWFPDLQSFDWLVVMGGPMNVYEEEVHPWLVEEKDLIKRSIAAGKVVLGICLGSQLIAEVIGGKVTANVQPEDRLDAHTMERQGKGRPVVLLLSVGPDRVPLAL